MIAIGDNVVDCYVDQGLFYPGGNAVNVAVNCRRAGFDRCSYIGVFGNDSFAEHIQWSLSQEDISWERSRHLVAKSGQPRVNLTATGDRVFVGGPKDTAQHVVRLRLTDDDLAYIREFDLVHTSCYSSLEPELPKLAAHSQVSFDFSDISTPDYLEAVCPHVRFAFFSGSHLSAPELERIVTSAHAMGTEIVGITLGGEGALFSHEGKRFRQSIIPTKVTDTMGAGDSFIAGFLTAYFNGCGMTEALQFGAERAAVTCTVYGAYGYPKALPTAE